MPFTPNDVQKLYFQDNQKLEKFKSNREIILKARQLGFSTLISALMFLDTINTPNTQSIIVAQDETNSKRIFQIIRRYYDNQPESRKRVANTDSKAELWWKDIDSYFTVGWAGSRRIGRGGTINNVHASEVAFWENAGEIVSGLLQSVPSDGNVFLESTANGVGNYFYKEYESAKSGQSVYKARFYPWFLDPTYVSDILLTGGEFQATQEEEQLAERFTLSVPQLTWRRNKVLELKNARVGGDDSVGDFPQEYPSTAEEAFLTTGVGVFSQETLINQVLPQVSTPLENYTIPRRFGGLAGVREIQNNGRIRVYQLPQEGHSYLICGDPSEGLNDDGDHDYCGTHVIDVDSWEQVCVLHGRWEPHDYAGLLSELGYWYNTGLIVVERNNHGHSVINSLLNHFEYGRMDGWSGVYFHSDYDQRVKSHSKKPGFPTNVKTKAMAIGSLNEVLEDGSLKINDKPTIEQMRLYSKLPGGKLGASIGHDDLVTALAIGSAVIKDSTFLRHVELKKRKTKKLGKIGYRSINKGIMV